jgi:bifunctional ADP-heptose synthase (sugar kinase/adenylyltransferase)
MLLALVGLVDQVVIYDGPTPEDAIQIVKPDIYCKGVDYFGIELPERALVEGLGGRIVLTTTPKWSSREIAETMQ